MAARKGVVHHDSPGELYPPWAGMVGEFPIRQLVPDAKSVRFMTRQIVLGVSSATLALREAGLDKSSLEIDEDCNGVIYGSGMTQSVLSSRDAFLAGFDGENIDWDQVGLVGYRLLPPLWILPRLPNTTAGQISIQNGLKGANYSVVNGPSSGMVAIGEAWEAILLGRSGRIVCGGSEWEPAADFVDKLARRGIASFGPNGSRSFSPEADGIACSEGGATLVLESEDIAVSRGAGILAWMVGYANQYLPDIMECGEDVVRDAMKDCMLESIGKAGLEPGQIDHVQACGCAIGALDRAEAAAIRDLFGRDATVSCCMPSFGNTLGASGALATYAAVLQLARGFKAPLAVDGPLILEDEVAYVRPGETQGVPTHVVCNSFDPFGNMVSLVLTRVGV